jgi:hypothetical protein
MYAPTDKMITIPGTAFSGSEQMSLNAGWNQIGYWGTSPLTGFNCMSGSFDAIIDEAGKVYVSDSPFNTLKVMHVNKGYFIHATTANTLRYTCQ